MHAHETGTAMMQRYFQAKIRCVAKKCRFCPIPKALRPWEVCLCPFFNTRKSLFEIILQQKGDRLNAGKNK